MRDGTAGRGAWDRGWRTFVLVCAALAAAGCAAVEAARPFEVVETGIPELRRALADGRLTSRQLVIAYLTRVGLYEDWLNAAITVNPRALAEADALDRERRQGKLRGPLHGIPIAIKDNIHTTDMPTTGGAVAFEGYRPPYDATVTRRLRAGGAIIIAKTVLTELASWVAGPPTEMPSNYSGLAGYAFNPYDPRRDPREGFDDGRPALLTGGSSSGSGTTASLWAASVGTETFGSIVSPSNWNMLVGIKPTVGRISRHGVIPVTRDQDTPGPMARTVTDAAILLGVLEGPDPNDPITAGTCTPPPNNDYTPYLRRDALKGARIGIPRAYYYDPVTPPGATAPEGGLNPDQAKVMAEAIETLRREGAVIVDPADLPSVLETDRTKNLVSWEVCDSADARKGSDQNCSIAVKYAAKRDFNAWLATLGPGAPVKTLTELRRFNLAHMSRGAIKYGQARLDISDEMDLVEDRARYEADRAKDVALAGTNGIDAAMKAHRLDALLFPGGTEGGWSTAARPGYPTVQVPFGFVSNIRTPPLPASFHALPAPFGVSFTGLACSEPRLIELGYAFEQATRRRVPPRTTP